jgi:hypothetical protein
MVPMRPSRDRGTNIRMKINDAMDRYADKFIYLVSKIN